MVVTVWLSREYPIVLLTSVENTHKKASSERCKILNIGCGISCVRDTKSDVSFEVSMYQCRKFGFIVSRNVVSLELPVYECNIHLAITFNNPTLGNVCLFNRVPACPPSRNCILQLLKQCTGNYCYFFLPLFGCGKVTIFWRVEGNGRNNTGVFTACCLQPEGN